ncbi:MAG: alkylated DNA repair dioxygenase AlkB [Flavobacteriaceae bacterium]
MNILFPKENKVFYPEIKDGEILYLPSFIKKEAADLLFKKLVETIPWKQDKIMVFGKTFDQPRLTSFHSLQKKPYAYSNISMYPQAMTKELLRLIAEINNIKPQSYNSVLLNLYRDGKDSNGWHSDNESELGINPVIASISLGEERFFNLKHKKLKEQKMKLKLGHGSLLIMSGEFQHHWLHQIPKTIRHISPRINLTFRKIL